ncbi:MAG: CBS domain-containing protein [Candidatus Omnitrophica bacterium]|nr:CBS domain-containing protein [Candidatus Omnitrophota bacterium]
MLAKDIMTKSVKSVLPQLAIREFASLLIKENISGAPVIDENGNFLGIVTEEDLIFQDKKINLPTFLNLFANIVPLGVAQTEEELKKIAGTKLQDIMQAETPTITPQTTTEEIATIMSENKNYYLVVLEDGAVVGVVTKRDLIKAVAKGKIW